MTWRLKEPFDVYDPLQNVRIKLSEDQLEMMNDWFDRRSRPALVIEEADEPIKAITINRLEDFLKLNKFHRRSFHYPTYAEIMKLVEKLKSQFTRLLTREQFIYMINSWVLEPDIKHELILAFQVFDTENRNFLDIEEIKTIVTTYSDIFNEEETIELLRDANVRGDGNVNYEEFVESMFNLAPELYEETTSYVYDDPDEDPSVPPLPEPAPEPELPLPPPPPPPEEKPSSPQAKGKNKGKGKGKK